MADTVIYTACFGGYDQTRVQAEQDIDVDWLYVTDGRAHPEVETGYPVWQVEVLDPLTVDHPNLAAKRYKARPPFDLGAWKYAIWIDANMQVTSPFFAREAIAAIRNGVAIWAHPRRDCVYEEIDISMPGGKEGQGGRYEGLPLAAQAEAYRAEGYPEHGGLYASGTIAWTPEGSEVIGTPWLAEIERWGFHDQISFGVVCWRLGIQPGVFPIHELERRFSMRRTRRDVLAGVPGYLGNRWLRIWDHARAPYPVTL